MKFILSRGIFWILLVAFALMIAVVFIGRVYYLRTIWPPIRDEMLLISDCKALLTEERSLGQCNSINPVIQVPLHLLPASISNINPKLVSLGDGFVLVTTTFGGIGSSSGYLIVPNSTCSLIDRWKAGVLKDVVLYKTKSAFIYRWSAF